MSIVAFCFNHAVVRNKIVGEKTRIWNWQIVWFTDVESLESSFIWLICKNKTFKLLFEYSLILTFLTYTIQTSEYKSMSNWLSLPLNTTSWIEIDKSVFDVKWI